jgi:cell division septation protein DedD
VQARAVLAGVAEASSPRQSAARFAVAEAWLRAGKPEQARDQLRALLDDQPGEMESEALERTVEISRRLGDEGEAARATRELEKLSPRTVEPVRRPSPPPVAITPLPGPARAPARGESGRIAVQIGAFSDMARARALLESARRSGFPRARMETQGRGGATLHLVRIGSYPDEAAARAAGERASRELGVAYRLIRNP